MKPRFASATCLDRWCAAFLGCAVLVLAAAPASAQEHSKKAPAMKLAPGSLLVHVDTKTMEMGLQAGEKTVPLELTADVLEKLNTSTEGLKLETKDGVTSAHLMGRFQGVWIAVRGSDGRIKPVCLTSLPPTVEAAAHALRQSKGDLK